MLILAHMLILAVRVFQLRLPTRSIRFLRPPHSYCSLSTMGVIGTQTVNTTDRLAALRKLMAERNIDAYIVPSEDQRRCSAHPIGDPYPYVYFLQI
jgi:hypothetical protein